MPLDRHSLIFSLHDDVPKPAADAVDIGLGVANEGAAPLGDVLGLSCFVRNPRGTVVGGAVGRTWGQCCELQQLWVDSSLRRHGIATLLVQRFEARARERGCRTFYLETFSFQAPALYERLGYRVELTIEGFGEGIAKYTMVKHKVW